MENRAKSKIWKNSYVISFLTLCSELLFFAFNAFVIHSIPLVYFLGVLIMCTAIVASSIEDIKRSRWFNKLKAKIDILSNNKQEAYVKTKELVNENKRQNIKSIIKDDIIVSSVPVIETEGSIIRNYDELSKEKEKYVSLLELLEKYKELERTEKANIVDDTYESSGYTYMKK